MAKTDKIAGSSKVVLVTGASSGIGRATAEHLASLGHRVFAGARRIEAAPRSDGITAVQLDVTDDASVAAAVGSVLKQAARLDVLVNNAGASLLGAVEEASLAQAEALFSTNVLGVLRVSKAVLPAMRRQGAGRIVNVSSVLGFLPAPFMGLYAASKHAVEGLSESMDHEVRGFGVRVILVEPGFIRTNIDAASARAAEPDGAYDTMREAALANIGGQVAKAPDPLNVARVIERAMVEPAFRRLPVGGQAALLSRLRRFMPAGMVDGAVRKSFGL